MGKKITGNSCFQRDWFWFTRNTGVKNIENSMLYAQINVGRCLKCLERNNCFDNWIYIGIFLEYASIVYNKKIIKIESDVVFDKTGMTNVYSL